ncbi:UNVERIFIED_CONTAM: Vestitone reductase [Sesamum radiatum]|uniref:Dihydroflavonol 4-reductase n=1 Tax=Sesamum radiatum TaxID=300843 RepID=A0AAW2R0F6_SESRA
MDPEGKRDISYLTNLPGASERLKIFDADLDRPDSFAPAIGGCVGVFHVAHPLDFDEKEAEETKTRRATGGTLGILQACLDSKTVRRVVYTSTSGTMAFNDKVTGSDTVDEESWTDVDFHSTFRFVWWSLCGDENVDGETCNGVCGETWLDLVVVAPSWIHGPFICPRFPDSVYICMALILGDEKFYGSMTKTSLVHMDDVVRTHIHLFEYPKAKGRYICSAADITIAKLHEFLSARYPQYNIPTAE